MELKDRVHMAAVRYLKMVGYKVIYENYLDKFIVAQDDDGVALIDMFYTADDMSTKLPKMKRAMFEDAIHKFFLQEHEPIDVPVRYDTIELFICGSDRALIRHHVNAELED